MRASDPREFSATWLLLPLALFVSSLFLPTVQAYQSAATTPGWELLWGSLKTPYGAPNYLYLLSLGLLAVSGGKAGLGRAGRITGWLAALGSLPPLLLFWWFGELPGYWVWAASLWTHALIPYLTRLGLQPMRAQRKSRLSSEVAISAAISAAPAALLVAILSLTGVEPPQGTALLVPSQFALAGSASLGTFVVVLAWRLLRARRKPQIVVSERREPRSTTRVAARWRRGVVRGRRSVSV